MVRRLSSIMKSCDTNATEVARRTAIDALESAPA
jgi:hypothetical protein